MRVVDLNSCSIVDDGWMDGCKEDGGDRRGITSRAVKLKPIITIRTRHSQGFPIGNTLFLLPGIRTMYYKTI